MQQINNHVNQKRRTEVDAEKKSTMDRAMGRKKMTKEERIQLMEEKKLKKEVSFNDVNYCFVLTCK
jgi:crossover junction endonuclease EME1